jgi:hypothetical protein
MTRERVKPRGYRFGVYWIAFNDGDGDPDALDPDQVAGMLTVGLLADLFSVSLERVAADVIKQRKKGRDCE